MSIHIYWPKEIQKESEGGFLVGWLVNEKCVVVSTVVKIQDAILLKQSSSQYKDNKIHKPKVVGIICGPKYGSSGHWANIEKPASSPAWVCVCTCSKDIVVRNVAISNNRYFDGIIMVTYRQFNVESRRFYNTGTISFSKTDLLDPQKSLPIDSELVDVISYINVSPIVAYILKSDQKELKTGLKKPGSDRASKFKLIEKAEKLLESSIFGYKLSEISSVVRQVKFKLNIFSRWGTLYSSKSNGLPELNSKKYAHDLIIKNDLWKILFDAVLGCIAGFFIIKNADHIVKLAKSLIGGYTITSLENGLLWLRGWPAGLKLNNGLGEFLGELFLWLIHFWKVMFLPLADYTYYVIVATGWAGVFGITVQLSILSDYLSIATLHTYWFYIVAARIYHSELLILHSLFNLFRGKKINVLRNRIDSCSYSLDQLLLGTILFTLLTYLFPTIVVYYISLLNRRLLVLYGESFLELVLACINNIPIYIYLARILDPLMFGNGVYFEISSDQGFCPKTLSESSHTYVSSSDRLDHINPAKVLRSSCGDSEYGFTDTFSFPVYTLSPNKLLYKESKRRMSNPPSKNSENGIQQFDSDFDVTLSYSYFNNHIDNQHSSESSSSLSSSPVVSTLGHNFEKSSSRHSNNTNSSYLEFYNYEPFLKNMTCLELLSKPCSTSSLFFDLLSSCLAVVRNVFSLDLLLSLLSGNIIQSISHHPK